MSSAGLSNTLNPAPLSETEARVFNRSRVDRARRSNFVIISRSPWLRQAIALRSSFRSVIAPETVSENTRWAPAGRNTPSGDRLQLPRRHLEPALRALVREGILKGLSGRRGGYRLARARQAISVY